MSWLLPANDGLVKGSLEQKQRERERERERQTVFCPLLLDPRARLAGDHTMTAPRQNRLSDRKTTKQVHTAHTPLPENWFQPQGTASSLKVPIQFKQQTFKQSQNTGRMGRGLPENGPPNLEMGPPLVSVRLELAHEAHVSSEVLERRAQ